MDTCICCNPASTRGYDPELFCEAHIHHAEGIGNIYRSATVNKRIQDAFTSWRAGNDITAAEHLKYAAVHSGSSVRNDVARIANLLASDTTQPGGALGYLAVVEICRP